MVQLNIDMLERTSNIWDNFDTFECFVLVTYGTFYNPNTEVSKHFLNADVIDKKGELTMTITCQGEQCQTFSNRLQKHNYLKLTTFRKGKKTRYHRGDCDFVLWLNRNTDITIVQAWSPTTQLQIFDLDTIASIKQELSHEDFAVATLAVVIVDASKYNITIRDGNTDDDTAKIKKSGEFTIQDNMIMDITEDNTTDANNASTSATVPTPTDNINKHKTEEEADADDPTDTKHQKAKKKAEEFFHHDKPESETPPVDPEFGKKPARDHGIRQAEHKEQRAKEAAAKSHGEVDVERRVKNSLRQADEYGREMTFPQTLPQTHLDYYNPFGGSMNEKGKAGMHDPK
ncbi:hypothetical protein R1sor_010002 [Riccia sorocarpa]|uniref:Uncharacterized protein n=1 Tax=Riccia sorocarpa TaxID=122646 RepID=A0ABD3HY65_9MARC